MTKKAIRSCLLLRQPMSGCRRRAYITGRRTNWSAAHFLYSLMSLPRRRLHLQLRQLQLQVSNLRLNSSVSSTS